MLQIEKKVWGNIQYTLKEIEKLDEEYEKNKQDFYNELISIEAKIEQLETPGILVEEKKPPMLVIVTMYTSWETCYKTDCIMASGKKAYIGAIACPRAISFNTKVVIEGKTYTCEDRTHIRFDGRYDIFNGYGKDKYNEAIKFGKKNLTVYKK